MKHLLFSIALALGIHGLIFYSGGEWLKNKPYNHLIPPRVTISLTSLPSATTSSDSRPLQTPGKKEDDMPVKNLDVGRVSERPVRRPEHTGASIQTDITPASGVMESNALTDLSPSPAAGKIYTEGDPEKVPEEPGQTGYHPAEVIRHGSRFIKDAVPLYKENPVPVYPPRAKKRSYEGTVILDVLVTKEGKAGKVSVLKSSGYSLLDDAAVSSVGKWRFEPGRRGDEKVDMQVKVPIRFQLE